MKTTLRRRRPADQLAGDDQLEPEQPPSRITAHHLDETITLQGFYCLHECRWPGTRNGRIDHVVVGATGVWVIADERPREAVGMVGTSLRSGTSSLDPQLRRVRDQATVLRGILGDHDVQPILSIHEASLPRHSFTVDAVRVAGSLWPTSQVIARPTPFLEPVEVEQLALLAVEALRPTNVVGPRLTPPGSPVISLPFVPCGSAVGADHRPSTAAGIDDGAGDAGTVRRRRRLRRRTAAGVVVGLMALGLGLELSGDDSSVRADPVADTDG